MQSVPGEHVPDVLFKDLIFKIVAYSEVHIDMDCDRVRCKTPCTFVYMQVELIESNENLSLHVLIHAFDGYIYHDILSSLMCRSLAKKFLINSCLEETLFKEFVSLHHPHLLTNFNWYPSNYWDPPTLQDFRVQLDEFYLHTTEHTNCITDTMYIIVTNLLRL